MQTHQFSTFCSNTVDGMSGLDRKTLLIDIVKQLS